MAVKEDRLAELLGKFDLPPLPKIAHALIQMLGDPDVSVQDLAGVINVEPILASRLIKVANSSMYGQTTIVTTVERAAIVLGLGYVKALCLANQLAAPLSQMRLENIDAEAFWRDSLLRACIGRQLGRCCKGADPEHAFLAGLLMDIAIPTLICHVGVAYEEAFAERGAFQLELANWEQENLELTHAELGGSLLASWNLPEVITSAVTYHHTSDAPAEEGRSNVLQKICYFSGALPLGASAPCGAGESTQSALAPTAEALNLDADAIAKALHAAKCECETIIGLFDNLLPQDTDIGQVMTAACECLCQTEPDLFYAAFS